MKCHLLHLSSESATYHRFRCTRCGESYTSRHCEGKTLFTICGGLKLSAEAEDCIYRSPIPIDAVPNEVCGCKPGTMEPVFTCEIFGTCVVRKAQKTPTHTACSSCRTRTPATITVSTLHAQPHRTLED